jgi:undecaprenyl diphosphate synthase
MTLKKINKIPQHIAIIMDGNGRWAKKKRLPRSAGHRAGLEVAKKTIRLCAERGIKALTLFAFSSENWSRPSGEVTDLMGLFLKALQQDINELHKNNIQFRIIGDSSQLSNRLKNAILEAEKLTQHNTGLQLIVAINYGGRWDIVQATQHIGEKILEGQIKPAEIDESILSASLSTNNIPDPDLFIRTSGELRISNFLLWQMAYTELFFTNVFWPEFDESIFETALAFYDSRKRRFGRVNKSEGDHKNA